MAEEPKSPKPPGASPGDGTSGPAESGPRDVVLLGPPTADGEGVHVLRARDERLEAGELRHIEEGRPITGELVSLSPRKENPRVCDVKESWRPPARAALPAREARAKGPAQVATQAYRDNWDEVFSSRPKRDLN